MKNPLVLRLLLVLLLGSACPSDQLGQLQRRLGDPLRREEAIAGLLQLVEKASSEERAAVRTRVVDALMDAYREDESRAELVAALAVLGDPRAAPVLAAALRDFERGGAYLEAAVRASRAIAELGLKQEVPTLVEVLGRSLAAARQEQTTWLKRALIESLDQLGDPRAVEILVRVLQRDPARQDFYLNKLAASALGRLRDRRAIRPLTAALSSSSHGLLLYEESRRALCRIGPPAVGELLAAASRRERGLPEANATAAVRVLGDLGDRGVAPKLAALARPKDPAEHQLAVAEARLRLGDRGGETVLREVLESEATLTSRRSAAELLGWYGQHDAVADLAQRHCLEKLGAGGRGRRGRSGGGGGRQGRPDDFAKRADPTRKVLCWSLALAHARLASAGGLAQLGALLAAPDAQTRHYLQTYRPRLELASRCAADPACYRRELRSASDWRVRERAVLELGRISGTDATVASELAAAFATAHPQVKDAILVALEAASHGLEAASARAIAALLAPREPAPRADPARRSGAGREAPIWAGEIGAAPAPPSTISRALCLAERLGRLSGGAAGGPGRPGSKPEEKR